MYYRTAAQSCPSAVPGPLAEPGSYTGCQGVEGTVAQASSHMTLYELDEWFGEPAVDGHDRVGTLRFPGTSVTLTGCDYDGCPERTTDWVNLTTPASVTAKLRMKARAYLEESCAWSW